MTLRFVSDQMSLKLGHVLLIRLLAKVTIVKQDFTAGASRGAGRSVTLGPIQPVSACFQYKC